MREELIEDMVLIWLIEDIDVDVRSLKCQASVWYKKNFYFPSTKKSRHLAK